MTFYFVANVENEGMATATSAADAVRSFICAGMDEIYEDYDLDENQEALIRIEVSVLPLEDDKDNEEDKNSKSGGCACKNCKENSKNGAKGSTENDKVSGTAAHAIAGSKVRNTLVEKAINGLIEQGILQDTDKDRQKGRPYAGILADILLGELGSAEHNGMLYTHNAAVELARRNGITDMSALAKAMANLMSVGAMYIEKTDDGTAIKRLGISPDFRRAMITPAACG